MRIPYNERSGILSGGNWIVDRVKIVDAYPEREHLANILSESVHNGGAAYNLLTDLSLLGAEFQLAGVGLVGEDADGDGILAKCRSLGIDASGIRRLAGQQTSFTDVVSEKVSGKRTFFHSRGANACLDSEHFDLQASRARIFHLGYLLLLDRLDAIGEDGRTKAYHLLARARDLGFKTAVDMVSSEDGRFASVVAATLPAVDILFLNEYEAEKATGIGLRGPGVWRKGSIRRALEHLLAKGVKEWAVLHFPDGACALSSWGEWHYRGSVKVPEESIAGTVGAGDAFAAGTLFGLHQGAGMDECLAMGVCAAAACLTSPGSSEGLVSMPECLRLGELFGFRDLSEVGHLNAPGALAGS
jgi:sugar/nucleoside kinase (ribokinase family)